jgi:hypothetical protein
VIRAGNWSPRASIRRCMTGTLCCCGTGLVWCCARVVVGGDLIGNRMLAERPALPR